MSLQRVLRMLEGFGLSRTDAEVYIYLAKKGPKSEKALANSLRLTKQELCRSLKNLQSKRAITVAIEKPALFSALTFEALLDLWTQASFEQAHAINETKKELLSKWRSSVRRDNT